MTCYHFGTAGFVHNRNQLGHFFVGVCIFLNTTYFFDMTPWSATDITLLSGALIGGVSSLILVIQRSTCTKVRCCGAECERIVRSLDELEANSPPDISIPPDLPIRHSDVQSSLSPSSVRDRVDELERRSTR